jgi:hypothetical protein
MIEDRGRTLMPIDQLASLGPAGVIRKLLDRGFFVELLRD